MLMTILLFTVILLGPHVVASLLLVGSPTVFGFSNQILRALPFASTERLLFLILAVMVFLQIAFSKEKRFNFSRLEAFILIFVGYAFISLVISATPVTLTQDGWLFTQYAMPMTAFIISRRISWSEHGIRMLLIGLVMAGGALAVIGVLQSAFGISVFHMDYQSIAAGHEGRASGTFSNAHTYATTLCIFLVLSLLLFDIYRDSLARLVLLLVMAAMLAGIVLGETRAPWGGAAITLAIIFLRHKNIRPVLMAGGAVAVVLGTAFVVARIGELEPFFNRVTDVGTLAGRLANWATAINMISDNPVFGVGFGAYSFALHKPDYLIGVGSLTAQYGVDLGIPHNEFLHVAVLLGTAGLVSFLAILSNLLRLLFDVQASREYSPLRRRLALCVGAVVVGLMFNSMLSDTHTQDYFWLLTYFLAGVAAGNPRESRNSEIEFGVSRWKA